MSVVPPTFDYTPVPPFHATCIEYGEQPRASVTNDLRTAVLDAWAGNNIFGAVVDGAGYAIGCYKQGYMIGVSAVFEIITQLTVEHDNSAVYDIMLEIEMFHRMNWPQI